MSARISLYKATCVSILTNRKHCVIARTAFNLPDKKTCGWLHRVQVDDAFIVTTVPCGSYPTDKIIEPVS